MAIRLLVERVTNLQAVVSTRSLRVVAPQFRAAEIIVTRPVYSALVAYPLYQTTVNYRRPVNSIHFRYLQALELVLDPDTKNRYFRDTDAVSFLDALSLAFERPLSNLAYLTEQAAIGYGKNVNDDALFASDLVHILLIIQREFFDSLSVEDQTLLSVDKLTQDVLGASDQINSWQVSKALASSAIMQDPGPTLSVFKDALDGISTADIYSAVVSFSRSFFEEVTAVSDARPIFDLNLGPAEELLPVDSLAYLFDMFAADEAFITDAPSIDYSRPESDTLAANDSLAHLFGMFAADEAFVADESSLDLNLGPAEELLPVDSLAYLFDMFAADEAFVTDAPSINYSRPESDTLAVNDLFERIVAYNLDPAEELLPVDSLAYLFDMFAADEAFVADESSIDYSRPESDTLAVNDLFERIVVYSRAFNDVFTLDDTTTVDGVIKDAYAVKTNVFGFSDESVFELLKAADDAVEATDSFSYLAESSLGDVFVVNESLVVAKRSTASSVLNIGAFNSAPFNN